MVRHPRPASLPLDPGDYEGTYKLIGGRMCLDFVNTVSYPNTRWRHDWLDRAANFLAWASAVELVTKPTRTGWARRIRSRPSDAMRAMERIRKRRVVIRAVLSPLAHGTGSTPAEVDAFNALLIPAMKHRRVNPKDLGWTWDAPLQLDDLIRPVVLDAAELLTQSDHTRIGYCPACDWLFYDATRNRSRRWCDMADCGSRDKSLRYYYRVREQSR